MSMSNKVDVVNVVLFVAQPQPPRGEGQWFCNQRGPCQAKGLAWPSACRRQTTYGHVFLFLIFLSNIPIIGRRYSSLT